MEKLFYSVELRDKDGKLYKNSKGFNVQPFKFEDTEKDENFVHLICQHTFADYKAVCKEGTDVNIEVRTYSDLTKTYPIAYSFYSAENKFVKH